MCCATLRYANAAVYDQFNKKSFPFNKKIRQPGITKSNFDIHSRLIFVCFWRSIDLYQSPHGPNMLEKAIKDL